MSPNIKSFLSIPDAEFSLGKKVAFRSFKSPSLTISNIYTMFFCFAEHIHDSFFFKPPSKMGAMKHIFLQMRTLKPTALKNSLAHELGQKAEKAGLKCGLLSSYFFLWDS